MPSKGNPETHNDSAHASINTDTKQSDNTTSDETSAASDKGKSANKTIDFSKLFADDPERNKKNKHRRRNNFHINRSPFML